MENDKKYVVKQRAGNISTHSKIQQIKIIQEFVSHDSEGLNYNAAEA
jgi:hypothetical protein